MLLGIAGLGLQAELWFSDDGYRKTLKLRAAVAEQSDLNAIHNKMLQHIESAGGRIDRIVYCPHLPDAGCDCRKPRPGLLKQLQDHYGIDMHGVPFVGDSERDLGAATAIGARPILVLTGNGRKTLEMRHRSGETAESYDNLESAVNAMLQEAAPRGPL